MNQDPTGCFVDNITPDIKKNVDYYLRKAGIITRKTIRSPRRPERGR